MEKLENKQECTALVLVGDERYLAKQRKKSKIGRIIRSIIFGLAKLAIELTAVVSIYCMVFSVSIYYSNKFTVDKLREMESHRIVDPVLEELKKDKLEAARRDTKKKEEKKKTNNKSKTEDKKKTDSKNKTDNKSKTENKKKADSKNKTDNKSKTANKKKVESKNKTNNKKKTENKKKNTNTQKNKSKKKNVKNLISDKNVMV